MAEKRLQKEIDDVLSVYDLDTLTEDTPQLGSLMEVIMNERPSNAMQKAMRVMQKGTNPKEVEAVLRLLHTQLWVIVPQRCRQHDYFGNFRGYGHERLFQRW